MFLGICFSFELIFFVRNPGNYSSGIAAIGQGIARLTFTLMGGNSQGINSTKKVYNLIY
jgi:hypothetical protein